MQLDTTHQFRAQCRHCGTTFRIMMTSAALKREQRRAWEELLHQHALDLSDDAVLKQMMANVFPKHICKRRAPECLPTEAQKGTREDHRPGLLDLVIRALADATQRGESFTIRGFCRQFQGLGGLGRERLHGVIQAAIADGKLALEDGLNGSGRAVQLLSGGG